ESVDHWHRLVGEWHAQLSKDIGSLSIGHSLRSRTSAPSDANYAVVQAAEAVLVGERLFGPGHVTSYADAQLAKFCSRSTVWLSFEHCTNARSESSPSRIRCKTAS